MKSSLLIKWADCFSPPHPPHDVLDFLHLSNNTLKVGGGGTATVWNWKVEIGDLTF